MTVLLLISFAAFLLEDDNLVSLKVLQYGCLYGSTLNIGRTEFYSAVVVCQKHLVKCNRGSDFILEAVYINLPPCLYLELLTCNIYNCVHKIFV